MSNSIGTSALLNDLQGNLSNGNVTLYCVAISSALVGTLSIYGLTTGSATPNVSGQTPWVIPSTSIGVFQHPGNGVSGGSPISYVLSNSADVGKVVVALSSSKG